MKNISESDRVFLFHTDLSSVEISLWSKHWKASMIEKNGHCPSPIWLHTDPWSHSSLTHHSLQCCYIWNCPMPVTQHLKSNSISHYTKRGQNHAIRLLWSKTNLVGYIMTLPEYYSHTNLHWMKCSISLLLSHQISDNNNEATRSYNSAAFNDSIMVILQHILFTISKILHKVTVEQVSSPFAEH